MTKNNAEIQFLIAHIGDLYKKSAERNIITYSSFLNDEEQTRIYDAYKSKNVSFFGGFHNAERKCAVFLPDYYVEDDLYENPSLYGVCFVRPVFSDFDKNAQISHRDVLGSLMALGITRESVGDIVIDGSDCEIAVLRTVSELISNELKRIGKYTIKVEIAEKTRLIANQAYLEKKVTVNSLRIDGVVSSVFNLSREDAKTAILSGLVSLNGIEVTKIDKSVEGEFKLSFRGKGKVLVGVTDFTSKKGRIVLNAKYMK